MYEVACHPVVTVTVQYGCGRKTKTRTRCVAVRIHCHFCATYSVNNFFVCEPILINFFVEILLKTSRFSQCDGDLSITCVSTRSHRFLRVLVQRTSRRTSVSVFVSTATPDPRFVPSSCVAHSLGDDTCLPI
jgi:hypothetical protein